MFKMAKTHIMPNMISARSNDEILAELGSRLRSHRLRQNLLVEEVARQAGLSRNTVGNAEAGRDPRLSTVVRILRVLGRLDALDAFLPEPAVSPMQLLKTRGRPRRRARRRPSDG